MSDASLRWKARLGSLKPAAALVALLAAIFLFLVLNDLSVASSNPTEPQSVAIGQLVSGEIDVNRYVSVSGTAFYPAAYEETEDGRTVSEYYFVADPASSHMVLVKADESLPIVEQTEEVTVFGLTHSAESDLKQLIDSDLADIRSAGFDTISTLYIGEGEKPVDVAQQTGLAVGLGVILLLCVATFFFPGTVFAPRPVDSLAAPSPSNPEVKATGQFQKLASARPSIRIGKGTRKFNNAVANIIPLEDRRLMVYIHHVMTYKTYGITVRKQESDWGAFVDSAIVLDIEPGKLYGWRDRSAVRLRYKDEKERQQTLIVSFNHAGAQADFVGLLRQMGFMVGSGEAPLM